jgi:hypothetical protein
LSELRDQIVLAKDFVKRLHFQQYQPTGWSNTKLLVNGKVPVTPEKGAPVSKVSSIDDIAPSLQPRDIHIGPINHLDMSVVLSTLTQLQEMSVSFGCVHSVCLG